MEQFINEIISILGTLIAGAIAAVFRLFTSVNNNMKEIDYIKKELNKLEGGQLAVISTKLENIEQNTNKAIELLKSK
jgi:hypothetical protein